MGRVPEAMSIGVLGTAPLIGESTSVGGTQHFGFGCVRPSHLGVAALQRS